MKTDSERSNRLRDLTDPQLMPNSLYISLNTCLLNGRLRLQVL